MNDLFEDNLTAKTSLAYNTKVDDNGRTINIGQPKGVNVHIICSECGRELKIEFSWDEVQTLLSGGQVQGMWSTGLGWQGKVRCPGAGGMPCTSRGGPTELTYAISVQDLRGHLENVQAGSRSMNQTVAQPPNNQFQQLQQQVAALQKRLTQLNQAPPPQPMSMPQQNPQTLMHLIQQKAQQVNALAAQVNANPLNSATRAAYNRARKEYEQLLASAGMK